MAGVTWGEPKGWDMAGAAHRTAYGAAAAAICVTLLSATAASGQILGADTAPVVFAKSDTACYRIPSLARRGDGGFVAVAQRRLGLSGGRMLCNDDGNIDLAVRQSADGRRWGAETTAVSSSALSAMLADPASPLHDPAFAALPPADRWVRAGGQGLVAVGSLVLMAFEVRYNTAADCGQREGCLNSPENVVSGKARALYLATESRDGGRSWLPPRRIHEEVYGSCVDRLVKDDRLRAALRPVVASPGAPGAAAVMALSGNRSRVQRNAPALARALGVDEAVLKAELPAVDMVLNRTIRVGPGNAAAFGAGGGIRVFMPGAPLSFYSDDLGKTWTCADTTAIRSGSERQATAVDGRRMVMTLRPLGGADSAEPWRRVATSADGGASWSADAVLETGAGPMPDAVAQGAVIAVPGTQPPTLLVSNIAGFTDEVRRIQDIEDPVGARPGSKKARREEARRDRLEEQNARVGLTLTRFVYPDGATTPVPGADCRRATAGSLVVWPWSAGYSAMVAAPELGAVAIAFEASDDEGRAITRLGFHESIRVALVPLASVPVAGCR